MNFYYLQGYRLDYDEDMRDQLAFRGFPVPGATDEGTAYLIGQRMATELYNDDASVENDWVIERW